MLLGYYNFSVFITYISAIFSIIGMYLAISHHFVGAIALFSLGTICDFLDGKVARCQKNRTDLEKSFGIQIDSLCDIINNNVFPIIYFYAYGYDNWACIIIFSIYLVCGIIRLAHFNVKESIDINTHSNYFEGMPTTTIALLMLLLHLIKIFLGYFPPFLIEISMLILGISFITKFKSPKMSLKYFIILIILCIFCIFGLLKTNNWNF